MILLQGIHTSGGSGFGGSPCVLDSCEGEVEGFGFRAGHGVIKERNVLVVLSVFTGLQGLNIAVWIRDR